MRFPADAIQYGPAGAGNLLVQLICTSCWFLALLKPFCGVSLSLRTGKSPLRAGRGWVPPSPGLSFPPGVGVRGGGRRELQCSAETQSEVKNAPARLLRQRQPSVPGAALPTVCKKVLALAKQQ